LNHHTNKTQGAPKKNARNKKRARPSSSRLTPRGFTPHYDILYNDQIHVIRVFLPVMKPETAQAIKVTTMYQMSSVTIHGAYIPSTLIGKAMRQKVQLKQPLLLLKPSPAENTGHFKLEIDLPNDVYAKEDSISIFHECWGIMIKLNRMPRKDSTSLNFVSCFGAAAIKKKKTKKITSSSVFDFPDPSSPSDVTTNGTLGDVKMEDAQQDQPPTDTNSKELVPKDLVGTSFALDGAHWGKTFKGKEYMGIINGVVHNYNGYDGYVVWNAAFDDCEEVFELDDLLAMDVIILEQYDKLADQCYADNTPRKYKKKKSNQTPSKAAKQ